MVIVCLSLPSLKTKHFPHFAAFQKFNFYDFEKDLKCCGHADYRNGYPIVLYLVIDKKCLAHNSWKMVHKLGNSIKKTNDRVLLQMIL